MNLYPQRRSNVFIELLLGAAVQLGLSRALSRVCVSAEDREIGELDLPRRIRPRARRRVAAAPTR